MTKHRSTDVEARAPMREDTMFRIASQTKALMSAGVMMPQEEGKLLVTDPVWKCLPEFRETSVSVPRTSGSYDVVKARRPITRRYGRCSMQRFTGAPLCHGHAQVRVLSDDQA